MVCAFQILLIGMCASALRGVSFKCSNLPMSVSIEIAQASLSIQLGVRLRNQQALTLSYTLHPINSRQLEKCE